MKDILSYLVFFSFILIFIPVQLSTAQEKIEKYSKVKITIQDKSDIKELLQAGLSLEGMKLEEQSVEVILSEREIMKLKDLGFSFEVLIDDMTKYYQERSRRTESEMKNLEKEMKEKYSSGGFGFGSMAGYYTYDEVVAELDSMRMLYPNLITVKDSIGCTLEGRTIWAVKISDNPDITEGEPEVFLNALIHAREPEGMMVLIYFMYHLLENYGSDPEITYLVDNREFFFVPVINADGYVYNQQTNPTGGGTWRKNRKDNGNGCFGVDNNRNFGYMWGYDNTGSSPDPCDLAYRGTEAFSELENQAIRDFCENHNFIISNNYHAYWNVVFTAWGYNLTQTPDSSIFNHTISMATQFNHYLNGNFYVPGNYPTNGDVCDWMYGEQNTKPKIFAYLTEVGNDNDGFWPVPDRIFPIAQENVFLNKVLAWGPGVIDNPPYILEAGISPVYCVPPEDSVIITATESNPDNLSSLVTAIIKNSGDNIIDEFQLSEIDTNAYRNTWSVPVGEDFYSITLLDSCTDIPSKFYYPRDLKFTTAGPVTLDSASYTKGLFDWYYIRPYVRNEGTDMTITNASIRIFCNDPWVSGAGQGTVNFPNIPPGETVGSSSYYVLQYIDSLFQGHFNLNAEIKVEGWTYWTDSIQVIITEVEGEDIQPLTYRLEQNYPNPFNPVTTIRYQIPSVTLRRAQSDIHVALKVYDILGNEIETLVNEEKPAGSYKVEFDASKLPSGVYFYQLKAGEYINTKKMVLMK